MKGKKLSRQRIAEILKDVSLHGVTPLPYEPAFLPEALSKVKTNWKLGDAIHYVTMMKHDIKEIVTDDIHY